MQGFARSVALYIAAMLGASALGFVAIMGLTAAGNVFRVEPTPIGRFPTPMTLGWRPIHDGDCPLTHPLKANPDSMIVHLPDQSTYDQTRNDRVRCYAALPEAERAGFRVARVKQAP